MNTKRLMSLSAVVLAVVGLAASFAPAELLVWFGVSAGRVEVLLLQCAGAAYCGAAAVNWFGRHVVIGGIYARPLSLGNLLHFLLASFALLKSGPAFGTPALWYVALAVSIPFALGFGWLVFGQGAACRVAADASP